MIQLHLMEPLAVKDVIGLAPEGAFKFDEKHQRFVFDFTALEPEATDNILLRYGKGKEDFDFLTFTKNARKYYSILDQKSKIHLERASLIPVEANDFEGTIGKGLLVLH